MFVWTWVLLGLCVAGLLLALGSIARVVPLALRIKRRADALSHSRLAASVAGLEIQGRRLSALQAQVEPLTARAGAAAAAAKNAVDEFKMPRAAAALQEAGSEISGLLEELR